MKWVIEEKGGKPPAWPTSRAHASLWRRFLSWCSPHRSITELPLPPNASLIAACLFCVALTKEKAVYEGGRTLKCLKMFYVLCFFLHWGALCVSPTVTHGLLRCRCGCFCCGNRGVKRWDGGLLRWAVFGFCCRFVCCCFFLVALGPFLDPTKLRKSLLTHLFLPSFWFLSLFSPLTLSLLHFLGNNLLLPFSSPRGARDKIPPRSRGFCEDSVTVFSHSHSSRLCEEASAHPPILPLSPPSSLPSSF